MEIFENMTQLGCNLQDHDSAWLQSPTCSKHVLKVLLCRLSTSIIFCNPFF